MHAIFRPAVFSFYRRSSYTTNCFPPQTYSQLYNRIGKRIIGVGRSEGTTGSGSDETARIPDSYEMPRNVFDLSASKRFGDHWELKVNLRDILAEKVYYKQFAEVRYADGSYKKVDEIVRRYKPGRNIGFSLVYKL